MGSPGKPQGYPCQSLHGIEKGQTKEQSKWTSAGHGPHCFVPTANLSNKGAQTEPEPPIPATICDANVQACWSVTNVSTQTSTCDPGTQVTVNNSATSPRLNASIQATEPPPRLHLPVNLRK